MNCNHQHNKPTVCVCFCILADSMNYLVKLPHRSPASQATAIRLLTKFSPFKEPEISFTPLESLPKDVATMTTMSHVCTHHLFFCLFQANASKRDNEFCHPLPLAVAQLGPSRPRPVIAATTRKINENLEV